jgi:hypothetical protein
MRLSRKNRFKEYLKPYWNDNLTVADQEMKLLRQEWCRQGRPRNTTNPGHSKYKAAKPKFRRLHRLRVNEYLLELNSEIERTAEVDSVKFLKMINRRKKNRSSQSACIIKFQWINC